MLLSPRYDYFLNDTPVVQSVKVQAELNLSTLQSLHSKLNQSDHFTLQQILTDVG